MNGFAIVMLARPRGKAATVHTLQVAAAGATTLLSFAVAMLAFAFWRVSSPEPGYPILAIGLAGLLLVPLITLGTATARLAARSRDDRLATLRLLGVTAARVRALAVTEITLMAAIGVLAGTLLAALLPLALGPLTVYGEPLSATGLRLDRWLPWWIAGAIPPALVAIAALSALFGLRRVVLSPLGVRTRQEAPRLSWLRVLVAALAVGGALLVVQFASPGWGVVVTVAALTVAVLAIQGVLGLVGPFAIALRAKRTASRTADAATLVAARGIEDDPRTAWRSVSALALATFVLIPAGSLLGYLDTISRSQSREIMTPDQLLLFADARTMLVALVAVSFAVVACQTALTQTATVLERRELSIALDRMGMPRSTIDSTRARRALSPTAFAVVGAALAAVIIAAPLVFIAAAVAPLFLLAAALVLGLGLLLVRAGVAVTRPVLWAVLDAPARGE
ncbi:FtsX-like permease family protein [Leucobacter albus]|uniref:FtsX-like permease family protein n=1 Tax=Leucobacter albus TaxID=272210 RepID=A0ABW3TN33_9MICO